MASTACYSVLYLACLVTPLPGITIWLCRGKNACMYLNNTKFYLSILAWSIYINFVLFLLKCYLQFVYFCQPTVLLCLQFHPLILTCLGASGCPGARFMHIQSLWVTMGNLHELSWKFLMLKWHTFHDTSWRFMNYQLRRFFIIFHELSWRFIKFYRWVCFPLQVSKYRTKWMPNNAGRHKMVFNDTWLWLWWTMDQLRRRCDNTNSRW